MKLLLVITFLFAFAGNVIAQTFSSVVKDTLQNPVMFAEVVVLNPVKSTDGTIINEFVTGTLTDTTGKFSINVENPHNKFLVISFVGFRSDTVKLEELKNDIILIPDTTFLPQVEIKTTRQTVTLEANKLKYDAQAIRDRKVVVSAFDLIKELPSVYSTDDESLIITGTQTSSILINGRVSTMSYSALINYLKTLPAEKVESVEITYNSPAEWNVKGAAINVVLQKERHYTYSGQVGANYKYNYANSSGMNASAFITSPEWNVDIAYDNRFYRLKSRMEQRINHNVKENIFHITSESEGFTKEITHDIYTSVTYSFDDFKTLNLSYVGTFSPKQDSKVEVSNSYTGNALSDNDGKTSLHNLSLQYKQNRKRQEDIFALDAGAEYTNYRSDYSQYMQYSEFLADFITLSPYYDAFSYNSNQKINRLMGYLNINNSLPGGWTFAYGLRYTYTKNDNNQTNDDLTPVASDNYQINSLIQEHRLRAYLSVRKKFLDGKLNLDATLADEYYNNDGYEINDMLPDFTLSYMHSTDHIFQLSNITSRSHPSFGDLQDYILHGDKYNVSKGNPYLRPDLQNFSILNYIFKQKYSFMLGYIYVKDNIVAQRYQMQDTLLMLRQTINLKKTQVFFFNFAFPVQIGKYITSQFQLQARWQRYQADDWFSHSFDNRYWQYTAINSTDILLSSKPKVMFSLNTMWHSHGYAAMTEYNGAISVDAAVKGQFWEDRLILRLSCVGIFESEDSRTFCNELNQDWQINSNFYNRAFHFSVVYKFRGYTQRERKEVDTSRFGM
ncbi:MAG: outer membrane beta-barrel protein [Bacteroidales bacterium]|nr:outer membrane beta-barrel protein [Bacteroidales bacterium]